MAIEHPYSFIAVCLVLASCTLVLPLIGSIFEKKPPRSVVSLALWLLLLLAISSCFGLWVAASVGFSLWKGVGSGALFGAWVVAKILESAPWKHFRI